jgi:hypothetical protein
VGGNTTFGYVKLSQTAPSIGSLFALFTTAGAFVRQKPARPQKEVLKTC